MARPRLLVVAGEASGDVLGAMVLEAVNRLVGDVDARGMGGGELSRAGLDLAVDLRDTTAMGGAEVLRRLPRQALAFARLIRLAKSWRPQAALLIDVPDFNLPLGVRLRRLGIPVLGLVAPQFWAWRAGRASSVSRSYDRLGCILPFEEAPLRRQGVDAIFVGHPAAETARIPTAEARSKLGIDTSGRGRCVALLPGSRPTEVGHLLLPMVRAADRLRRSMPDSTVLLARAPTVEIGSDLPEWIRVVTVEDDQRPGCLALAASEAAVVASGTATLEAALQGTPQVAVYRFSAATFLAARLLVRTRFFALPNVLLNRPVVPELLQGDVCEDRLIAYLSRLLDGGESAAAQRRAAEPLLSMLRGPGLTATTSSILAEVAGW